MTTRLLASSTIVIDYCYSAASAGSFYGHMANHAFILLIAILTTNSLSKPLIFNFILFLAIMYDKIPRSKPGIM